jgi:hypothetical protein
MGGGVGTHRAVNGSAVGEGTGVGVGAGVGGSVMTGEFGVDELEELEPQPESVKAPMSTVEMHK